MLSLPQTPCYFLSFPSTKQKIKNISSEIQMLMSSLYPSPSLNLLVIQPLVKINSIVIKSEVAVPEVGTWLCFHVVLRDGSDFLECSVREGFEAKHWHKRKKPAGHQRKPWAHMCQHLTHWFTCWLCACCVLDIVRALSTYNRGL